MKTDRKTQSLEELKKGYQDIQAPNWLLQDTIRQAEQQYYQKQFSWTVPVLASLAVLVLVVVIVTQQSEVTRPTLKTPSLAGLHTDDVKPEHFKMPSTSVLGHMPTIPKTPIMPKRSRQTSQTNKQDLNLISNLYLYKEVIKHV